MKSSLVKMKSVSYSEAVQPFVALLSLGVLHLPTIQACGPWSLFKTIATKFMWVMALASMVTETWQYLQLMLLNSPLIKKGTVEVGLIFVAYKLSTLILVALSVSRHMTRFIGDVDGYCLQNGLAARTTWLRAYQASAWLIFLGIVSWIVYEIVNSYVCTERVRCLLTAAAMTLMGCFSVCVSLLPLLLYLLVWLIVLLEARRFNKDLRNCKFERLDHPSETLEDFRLRHMSLCHMLNRANDVVGWYLFLAFGAGIPLMMFCIRALVLRGGNSSMIFMDDISIIIMVFGVYFQFAVLIFTGAVLNKQMHEPVTYLYDAKLRTYDGLGRDSLQVFVNYLQFQTLGFQVKGLFVINTSTISLVAALMSTYGVFIFELPADGAGQHSSPFTALPSFNITVGSLHL